MTDIIFPLPFQFGCLLFLFIACVARISNTMLKSSIKNGHLCLLLDLKGKSLFYPWKIMLSTDFPYMASHIEISSFYTILLRVFNHKRYFGFFQCSTSY